MLAVAGNDSDLLAVLTESVKLVLEGGLELLTGDVGQLSLGDEGFGLSTDQFLLENDDARRVGILVLELGDLVGDFLLACDRSVRSVLDSGKRKLTVAARLDRSFDVTNALDSDTVLVVTVDKQIL